MNVKSKLSVLNTNLLFNIICYLSMNEITSLIKVSKRFIIKLKINLEIWKLSLLLSDFKQLNLSNIRE